MKKRISIIDFNLGNLFSVKQACETVGLNAIITSKIEDIEAADALILPGVGAFNEAMENLRKADLIEPIKHAANMGKPLFGVCLGLQLLFSHSEEFGSGDGLNLISGGIKRFPGTLNSRSIKVPQIAWNRIAEKNLSWKGTPLQNLTNNDYMYFVHSYFVVPDHIENESVLTTTDYEGLEYCSSIFKKNIFATQFHPEKSGEKGLSIYKNWAIINNLI